MSTLREKIAAEFWGTFILVFTGTGAVIINQVTNGAVSHLGIGITFGLVIMSLIYALGDISGAHFNPAVTIGFGLTRRLQSNLILPFIGSQIAGGIAASLILKLLFPTNVDLGSTHPFGAISQTFLLEIVLTAILMFVILNVSTGTKEKGITAGITVGAIIGLEAIFAGPISGASMNPVRSLAPSIVSGDIRDLWIYIVAPIIGASLGVLAFLTVKPSNINIE
jgi:aquaporin Z